MGKAKGQVQLDDMIMIGLNRDSKNQCVLTSEAGARVINHGLGIWTSCLLPTIYGQQTNQQQP